VSTETNKNDDINETDQTAGMEETESEKRKLHFPWWLLPLLIIAMVAAFFYKDRDKPTPTQAPSEKAAEVKEYKTRPADGWQIPVFTGSPGSSTAPGGGPALGGSHHH